MSSVNPTPDETSLISSIFLIADPQGLGIITGDAAVKILSGANLSNSVLGEIWASADQENNGFLTRNGVAIAVRLMGYAQQGQSISDPNLLSKPGPLPVIEGISPSKVSSDHTGTSLPPLTQQDKTKFLKLFVSCGPSNGLLSSDKARDIFIKSKLAYDKLSQIWNLADSKVRGALDATDFIIGMYFLQACLASPSFVLPKTLPHSLYEQASLTPDSTKGLTSHTTGNSLAASSVPAQTSIPIVKQHTGQSSALPSSVTVRPQYTGQQATPISPRSAPNVVPPASRPAQKDFFVPQNKQAAELIFAQLDTQHKGYIEADVAVPFMLKSGLSSTDLAQIWDLADINNDGRLTRAGFAVAMRLINSKLAGNELPETVPSNFTSSPTPSQLQFPNNTALNDLDLLFDTSSSAVVQQQTTGGSNQWYPQNGGAFTNSQLSPIQQLQFQQQRQQSPIPSRGPAPPPTHTFDLLGDEEDANDTVPNHSVEIGNLQNQVSSTTRSLDIVKTEKESAKKTVQQQAEELAQLKTQLATARASYETEMKLLGDIRERALAQQADITKSREELITAEGELSAVKAERNEIQSALLRDKEEVRELQRKLKEAGAETEALKVGLEKLKKDARQQKGLLAIAKKQLATAEAEKLKVHKEIENAEVELDDVTKEKARAETQISVLAAALPGDSSARNSIETPGRMSSPVPSVVAANIPIPSTPAPSSPSVPRQATNPFDLLILGALNSPVSEANSSVDPERRAASPLLEVDFLLPTRTKSPLAATPPVAVEPHTEETPWVFVDQSPRTEEANRPSSPEAAVPKSPPETSIEETFSPLREVEEDSFSDSEDEEPPSVLKEKVTKPVNGTPSQSLELETKLSSFPELVSPHQVNLDIFDVSQSNSPVAAPSFKPEKAKDQVDLFSGEAEDPFGASIPPGSPTVPVNDEHGPAGEAVFDFLPATATIKDFDEGFNNIPQKEVAFNPRFDSVFEDHFDFAKVAAEDDKHPKIEPPANTQPSATIADFTAAPPIIPTVVPQSSKSAHTAVSNELPQVEKQTPLSFDDIFQIPTQSADAPMGATMNMQQDNVPGLSVQNQHVITPATQPTEFNPFPLSFSDDNEHRATATSDSSLPPQRSHSPPIRSSSPPRQPRVSIGLSRNTPPGASSPKSKPSNSKLSESRSEQPSKHKLSIRFFGKKDKDKKDKEDKRGNSKNQSQDLEAQQLSPSFAEPFATGTGTPASDDDVEPVKQLSAMGFSRSQAIAALEAHGYDVQRALNSLLGAS